MSTLQTTNLKNPSSASNNIVLGTGGDTTVTNNLTVSGTGNHSIAGTLRFNSGYGSAATAYGCRAWVNFDGTTATPSTIRGSGNVSSVTKNATGDYTVNFTTAMVDTNYCPQGSCNGVSGNSHQPHFYAGGRSITDITTSSVRFMIEQGGVSLQDREVISVAIFR